jgi:hypothetical protein
MENFHDSTKRHLDRQAMGYSAAGQKASTDFEFTSLLAGAFQ